MVQALFTHGTRLDVRTLLRFATTNSEADREAAASADKIKSGLVEGPAAMPPDRAWDDVHRKLRSGRLPLTAIKLSRSSNEQIPVPPAELNDLVFRFTPDDLVVPVGLWSRSRDLLVWRSPQFLRSDVHLACGRPERQRQPWCPARYCATCVRSCPPEHRSPNWKRSGAAWPRSLTPTPEPSRRHGRSSNRHSREGAASTARERIELNLGNVPTKPPAKKTI